MTTQLTYTLGKFVWRELFTHDVAQAKQFYAGLFGWTAEEMPMGPDYTYTIFSHEGHQIAGVMDIARLPANNDPMPSHWSLYVSVTDVDQAAERAVEAGGKVLNPPMNIPEVGRFAVIQDPQGGVFNLFRSASGDAIDRKDFGHFCWEQLVTPEPAKAAAFYQEVVGWTSETRGEATPAFFNRSNGGEREDVASLFLAPPDAPAHWQTYVLVANLHATSAKAISLGGVVAVDRHDVPGFGTYSLIQDPGGAFICAFQPASMA